MSLFVARLRSMSFLAAAAFFFLPLLTVSCPGGSRTFSGYSVASGTSVEIPQIGGPPRTERVGGEPLAAAAMACAVVGILVGLARGSLGRALSLILASAGAVLLLLAGHRIGQQLENRGLGVLTLSHEVGFWSILAAFGLAFILSFIGGRTGKDSPGRRSASV